MSLTMIGVSHNTAPVEVRERLAFTAAGAFSQGLISLRDTLGERIECVLLSTCNRTELYLSRSLPEGEMLRLLLAARGIAGDPAEWLPYIEERRGHRAVEHLFRVAAGLESMVLGEDDIVRQIKEAYASASDSGMTGNYLNPLFHDALRVAKRARTETGMTRGAFSIGHAAVQVAESIFGNLHGRTVLLLGAGAMSETTARHLVAGGASTILVANRTFDRAAALAESLNGRAIRYDDFPDQLATADIVISSTAAPHPVVTRPMVESVLRARRNRPLYLVDIAVPRDIESGVGDLDNVFLYNIDHFHAVLDADLAERRARAARAEVLVHDEAVACAARLRSAQTATPLLTEVRAHLDTICQSELARLRQRLPHLSDSDWREIERFTLAVENKIAHAPTVKIKEFAAAEQGEHKMETVRELFGLARTELTTVSDTVTHGEPR